MRVSASTRGSGQLLGYLFAMAMFVGFLVWPYMLGDWFAGVLGAGKHSMWRAVLGWTLEVPYAVLLLGAFVRWVRR